MCSPNKLDMSIMASPPNISFDDIFTLIRIYYTIIFGDTLFNHNNFTMHILAVLIDLFYSIIRCRQMQKTGIDALSSALRI